MPTSSVALKAKLYKPCKKLLQVLKFKLKRPILKPLFGFRKLKQRHSKKTLGWLSCIRRRGRGQPPDEMDQLGELRSLPELGTQEKERLLFPSPLTPAYIKAGGLRNTVGMAGRKDSVEDACRSFENYLVEMIVEEGKVRDLTDVEELLYCWRNLKCPVFNDLVCRFYGELCMELFSSEADEEVVLV